ncbi:ankyrin repeat domain-containing protein SOWAHA [Symphorus nematophorus]
MSDVSEESLLDYFYSTGGSTGRVKNADLLKTFKPFIGHSDLQLRAKYREEFKLIIDRIAVVKSENGEKYLVLKKKYRQMLHERDAKNTGTDGDGQRHSSPARTPATVQWDATDASTSSPQQKEQQDEPMSCGEPDSAAEDLQTVQDPSAQSNGEDELDKDSGSKSESEQDEESTGSMGSAAVALDPIEKEWIYSAAGARVPDLSQLLRQDPSLANKKIVPGMVSGITYIKAQAEPILKGVMKALQTTDWWRDILHKSSSLSATLAIVSPVDVSPCLATTSLTGERVAVTEASLSDWTGWGPVVPSLTCADSSVVMSGWVSTLQVTLTSSIFPLTALHWAAKHGSEDMATLVADAGADVNTKSGYTPLHIAALHGHRHILDLLIGTYGAKENLRDYSGRLAFHYLNIKEPEGPEEDCELQFQVTQARERNRNRKLVSLFHSKKKWGSAEELAPIEEERTASHQLVLPPFRPRKFSR